MRTVITKMARSLGCGALWLLAIGPAAAGSIAVNPVRVGLTASNASGALVVRNSGADASVVQLQVLSWSQQDGQDVYVPTKELLATPPIFTVPAGGSQTVRVGLRQRPDARSEAAYRLILQEVPPPPKPEFRGLQVALRLSVPVFVAPAVNSAPSLSWHANLTSQGELSMTAKNAGNAHVQVIRFKLFDGAVEVAPRNSPEAAYLLAGQSHNWNMKLQPGPAAGKKLRVLAQTDVGDLQAEVEIATP